MRSFTFFLLLILLNGLYINSASARKCHIQKTVRIAVIDTGIKLFSIFDKIIYLKEYTPDYDSTDYEGHGTAVAQVLIETFQAYNHPCRPSLKVFPIKVRRPNALTIAEAFDRAIEEKIDVINMSLPLEDDESLRLKPNFKKLEENNILLVIPVDNIPIDFDNISYFPGNYHYNNILTVGGVDRFQQLSKRSGYGKNSVDIATQSENVPVIGLNGEFKYLSGTSFASPRVAAVAGLLRGFHPTLPATQIREHILMTATQLDHLQPVFLSGGVLNYERSLSQKPQLPR